MNSQLFARFLTKLGRILANFDYLLSRAKLSSKLFLREKTLKDLREKHGSFEKEFEEMLGFSFSGLSESEAQYLLRTKSIERIRNQLIKAISKRESGND